MEACSKFPIQNPLNLVSRGTNDAAGFIEDWTRRDVPEFLTLNEVHWPPIWIISIILNEGSEIETKVLNSTIRSGDTVIREPFDTK